MVGWLEIIIAVPSAVLIVVGLWKASDALTRRGIIVRPVNMMDASMTKIEKRFRSDATASADLASADPPLSDEVPKSP